MVQTAPEPTLKVLYDGLCPVCAREMHFLKRRDRSGAIELVDIAAAGFDPSVYGITMQQAIGAMHAVKNDGTILRGVDVFIELYRRCGLGWLSTILGFKPTRPLVDLSYRVFARIRPRLSKFNGECVSDRCHPSWSKPGGGRG